MPTRDRNHSETRTIKGSRQRTPQKPITIGKIAQPGIQIDKHERARRHKFAVIDLDSSAEEPDAIHGSFPWLWRRIKECSLEYLQVVLPPHGTIGLDLSARQDIQQIGAWNLRSLLCSFIMLLIVIGSSYTLLEYLLLVTRAAAASTCPPATRYIPVTYTTTETVTYTPPVVSAAAESSTLSTSTSTSTATSYITVFPALTTATVLSTSGGASYFYGINSGTTSWFNGVSPSIGALSTTATTSVFVSPVATLPPSESHTTITIRSTYTKHLTVTPPPYTSTVFSFLADPTTSTTTSTRTYYTTVQLSYVAPTKPSHGGVGAGGWNTSTSVTKSDPAADASPLTSTQTQIYYWGTGNATTLTSTRRITSTLYLLTTTTATRYSTSFDLSGSSMSAFTSSSNDVSPAEATATSFSIKPSTSTAVTTRRNSSEPVPASNYPTPSSATSSVHLNASAVNPDMITLTLSSQPASTASIANSSLSATTSATPPSSSFGRPNSTTGIPRITITFYSGSFVTVMPGASNTARTSLSGSTTTATLDNWNGTAAMNNNTTVGISAAAFSPSSGASVSAILPTGSVLNSHSSITLTLSSDPGAVLSTMMSTNYTQSSSTTLVTDTLNPTSQHNGSAGALMRPSSSSSFPGVASASAIPAESYDSALIPSSAAITRTSDINSSFSNPFPPHSATATPTTCGEHGNFVMDFDDLPNFTPRYANSTDITQAPPVPNPYHHLTFSNGYVYAPMPREPYTPTSPPHLAVFLANASGVTARSWIPGEIADGRYESLSAFWFDAYNTFVGCDNAGPDDCTIVFSAYTWSTTAKDSIVTYTQNATISPCPMQQNCELQQVSFPDVFRSLSGIQMQAFVGKDERMFFMDDLSLGWSNNTCAAGLARLQHQYTIDMVTGCEHEKTCPSDTLGRQAQAIGVP